MNPLQLGVRLPPLSVVLYADVYNTFGIDVTDKDGLPVDLTGLTASLRIGDLVLPATTDVPGSAFNWEIAPASTSSLEWSRKAASLTVTGSGKTTPWAVGVAELIQT